MRTKNFLTYRKIWLALWIPLGLGFLFGLAPTATAATINVGCDVNELVNAINTANTNPGADILELSAGCAYTLTTVNNTDPLYGDNGLPVITSEITMHGNGASISGITNEVTEGFNLLQINDDAVVNLDQLTITKGNSAIRNLGALTVTDSALSDNRQPHRHGAALYNKGTATLLRTTLDHNWGEAGGAIFNMGTVDIRDSSFTWNDALGGAGALANSGVSANIINTTFAHNGASAVGSSGYGGAIYNRAPMTIENCLFQENVGVNSVGLGSGGAIDNRNWLTVRNSRFIKNKSDFGGAVFNDGTLTLETSTFKGNIGTHGGAVANHATLTLSASTFIRNRARFGGGIYNSGPATIANATLYGNRAGKYGGNIANAGDMLVVNATLAHGRAKKGASIYNSYRELTLQNTILEKALGANCYVEGGSIINGKRNLDADGSCGVGPATNPLLDPKGLQNNGGPTRTIGLLKTSPAVDKGKDSVCNTAPINGLDQRGITRPQGAHCDIGAYELEK